MNLVALTSVPITWQLAAVSIAAAVTLATGIGLIAGWLLRQRPAPVQYGLLLSVLVLCLAAPLVTHLARTSGLGRVQVAVPLVPVASAEPALIAPAPESVTPATGLATGLTPLAPPPAKPAWSMNWPAVGTVLLATWIIGCAIALLRIVVGWVLVQRLVRSSRTVANPTLLAAADRARQILGLRTAPGLRESAVTPTPMVVGLFRPRIMLPVGLADRLEAGQLDAVLLHELAHIAHRDPMVGLIQRLAAALFWWCPLLHMVNRRINDLREDICDNYVIQSQGDGFRLAKVLVDLAEQVQSARWLRLAGAMAVTEPGKGGLEARVKRLLQGDRSTVTRMNLFAACATAAFAALLGGVMLVTTVRAADKPEDAANAKTPELRVRAAKQQGQFDLELRIPGKGSNPRMTVEAGKWGTLEVALDAATQLSFRARVNADKPQVRVSCQVTVAVTGGFQQWTFDDEPWPLGEWKALKETATSQPATGEFSGVKEIRLSRGIPGPTGKTVTLKETIKGPEEIDQLLATIKLEEKNPSGCRHLESALFITDHGEIEVSLCEHCFDFGGKTYRMPTGFYQRFKAYLGDSVAWGETVAGLAVGVRACQDDIRPGEVIDLGLFLRNVSDKPIRVGTSESGRWELAARARVTGPDGKIVEPKPGRDTASVAWRDGGKDDWPTLKPGQTIGPLHVQLQTDPEWALTKGKWYDISKPGEYTIELMYALPTDVFMEGRPSDAWAGGKAVSGKAAVLHRGDAKPAATQPAGEPKPGIEADAATGFGPEVAGLRAKVTPVKKQFVLGEPVTANYVLKNFGKTPVQVWHFAGSHDIVVKDAAGKEVAMTEIGIGWRKAFENPVRHMRTFLMLAPGEEDRPPNDYLLSAGYKLTAPGRYSVQVIYKEATGSGLEGDHAVKPVVPSNVAEFEILPNTGDAKPAAIQPIDQAKDAKAYVIDTQGRHTLFSDQRVTVIGDVHERGSNLVYTVSIQDAKGSLTKGPWPLQPGTKWFMYVEAPNVWVFDGDDTVRLVHLDSSDQDRGLSDRTVKEFPEIMKTAPRPFLDKLPDNINLGADGKSVEAPNLQSSHDGPAAEKPAAQESSRADWGEAVNGLQTRLIAEKDRVKAGEPIRLKLELRNAGTENRSYDSQQVAVNDPLIVRGPKGEEIPFVAGRVQTLGGGHSIKPGETVVLFDGLDAAGQYLLTAPGVYTFQFRGIGKEGFAFRGKGEPSIPPSNEVQVELTGEPTATMKREAALLKATPDGWHFARIAGGDGRVTPAGRQEGRGCEYVWTTVAKPRQTVRLWITEKPTAGVAGATEESEDLGPTRAGHAYVWASVGAWEAWRHLRTDIRVALGEVEDWFDQQIRSGRVVEGKPLALGGGLALSVFCQAQAAPPTPEKPTPLIVGVRVTNTGEKNVEFQPSRLNLMLKWGDGPMQDVGINMNGSPRAKPPLVLKPGEKWTWTVADAQLGFGGKPVYLAFFGVAEPDVADGYRPSLFFERELKGKADRIAFAARYEQGKPESPNCEPVVCRLADVRSPKTETELESKPLHSIPAPGTRQHPKLENNNPNRLTYRRLEPAKAAIFAPANRPHLLVIRSSDEAIETFLSTGILTLDARDNRMVIGGAGPKTENRGDGVEVTVTVTGNGSVTPVGAEVGGPVRDAAEKLVNTLGVDFTRETLIAVPPLNEVPAQVESVSLTGQLTVDVRTVPPSTQAAPAWDLVVIPRKVDRLTPVEFRNQGTTIGQIDLRGIHSSRTP